MASVFTLARFSEAFLILRAQGLGLSLMFVPLVLVVLNIAYALSAFPVGVLSDRMSRITLLIAGLSLLIAADLVLALAPGLSGVLGGVVLWGLHMVSHKGCWQHWWPMPLHSNCGAPPSACSTLLPGLPSSRPASLPGPFGMSLGRKEPFLPEQALPVSP